MAATHNVTFCGPQGIPFRLVIGRYKEKNVQTFFNNQRVIYVYKGRSAIRLGCELLGLTAGDEILAPAYNCGSEIDVLLGSGLSVTLFQVDKSCSVDLQDIKRRITKKTKAIYLTHYFGFPSPAIEVRKICYDYGLHLIEDCALSLFSRDKDQLIGSTGDVSIFSLPKTLPVPDGGILMVNNPLLKDRLVKLSQPSLRKVLYATLPLLKAEILKHTASTHYFMGVSALLSKKGGGLNTESLMLPVKRPSIPSDYYYNEKLNGKAMSSLSRHIITRLNPESLVNRRRENYNRLRGMLSEAVGVRPLYSELQDGVCPLSFPLLVENREPIRRQLAARFIDAGAWWKGYHKGLQWDEFPDACFLKDHLLTLPIHQRLDEKDMAYIAENVLKAINN